MYRGSYLMSSDDFLWETYDLFEKHLNLTRFLWTTSESFFRKLMAFFSNRFFVGVRLRKLMAKARHTKYYAFR